jgi:hypothetical protein
MAARAFGDSNSGSTQMNEFDGRMLDCALESPGKRGS